MRARAQKRLALAGAALAVLLFVAANAHLLNVALVSQPECRVSAQAAPARPAC